MEEFDSFKKLIDEKAITYIDDNEKLINTQLNTFIKMNTPCILGIDLSNSNDRTAIVNVPIQSKG